MSDKKLEARERLLEAMPYLRHAVAEAKEEGIVNIGILSVKPDGSGVVKARFEASEFFEDLALVIGAPDQTEDDELNAKAVELLQKLGLK